MPLMDEFKEERDEIRQRSFKERMAYFWDYYKWHVIGTAVGILVVGSLLYSFISRKEMAYYVAFVNVAQTIYSEDYKNTFAEKAGINLKKQAVYLDSDLRVDFTKMDEMTSSSIQKIMVYMAAGDMDGMVGDLPCINRYAYNGVFEDLRNFLTEEEFQKYEPYFFYADKKLIEAAAGEVALDFEFPATPMDPSGMEEPIPVAIKLDQCPKLRECYAMGADQYFAVTVNNKHPELNHVFLNYLFEN